MKNRKTIMRLNIFYLILATLFVAACNQEELGVSFITSDTTFQAMVIGDSESNKEDEKEDKGKENCFELVYPLSVTMPDGSVLSGEKNDLWKAVKLWYKANPNSKEKPNLIYPIDIHWLEAEAIKAINNENEMEIVKKYCDKDKKEEWKVDCFKLVYPITWLMPDGSTISMTDAKDWDAIKTWYKTNPNSEEKPSLNYPVEIELKDGTLQTVIDENEMEIEKNNCE